MSRSRFEDLKEIEAIIDYSIVDHTLATLPKLGIQVTEIPPEGVRFPEGSTNASEALRDVGLLNEGEQVQPPIIMALGGGTSERTAERLRDMRKHSGEVRVIAGSVSIPDGIVYPTRVDTGGLITPISLGPQSS